MRLLKSRLKFSMCTPRAKEGDDGEVVSWDLLPIKSSRCLLSVLTGEERLRHSLYLVQSVAQCVHRPLLASGSVPGRLQWSSLYAVVCLIRSMMGMLTRDKGGASTYFCRLGVCLPVRQCRCEAVLWPSGLVHSSSGTEILVLCPCLSGSWDNT